MSSLETMRRDEAERRKERALGRREPPRTCEWCGATIDEMTTCEWCGWDNGRTEEEYNG